MSGKRGKGEGSVHRLPSGNWQSQIMDGYTHEGKRHIVSFTAPTRAEALDKMRGYLSNKDVNSPDETPKTPLFADYAQSWYIANRTQVISNERSYTFAAKKQDQSLWSMATCHSLRRNFCTWLYCRGISTQELYQQMGHAMKTTDRHSMSRGKTPSELYVMCLQKYVRSTAFSPARHLRYNADSKYTHTEVPASVIELVLPPNGTYEITIQDTEPQNQILVTTNSLKVEVRYKESLLARSDSSEFLTRDGLLTIQSKRYPFRSGK